MSNEKDVLFTARMMFLAEHRCSCRTARPQAQVKNHLVVVSCHCGFVTSFTVSLVVNVQRRVHANDNDSLASTVARILEPARVEPKEPRQRMTRFRFGSAA